MSKPVELWNLLLLIKSEKYVAEDWYQFVRRYCGGYIGKFGWVTDGATNILELNQKLRDNCYIRREKKDVLKELPEVITEVIKVPITNKRAIVKATDNIIDYLLETKGVEAAEKAEEAEHLVALGVLRKLSIEGKLKAVESYLRDWSQSNEKLLVFGLLREPLDYLSEKFKADLIAGGVSSKDKQRIVKEWQVNNKQFLFANMESAGTGVDGLQNVCSNMIILELPWRPSDLWQVIGRLDRSGQKNSPNIKYLLSDDTIDIQMWEMLQAKEEVITAVNKGQDIKKSDSGMRAVMKKLKQNKKKK
jgi:SWI/SNF-related matrix-associated actin-dependent regulator 1 of chromatin subfamily A